MDQSLSATAGAGTLLNIGTTVATTAGAGVVGEQPAQQGFGFTMRQAQQQSPSETENRAGSGGQGLPSGGEMMPPDKSELSGEASAKTDAGQQMELAESSAAQSGSLPESVSAQEEGSQLQSDLFNVPQPAVDPRADQVLQQIDRYQKADLSVAVDSALQQFAGAKARRDGVVGDVVSVPGHNTAPLNSVPVVPEVSPVVVSTAVQDNSAQVVVSNLHDGLAHTTDKSVSRLVDNNVSLTSGDQVSELKGQNALLNSAASERVSQVSNSAVASQAVHSGILKKGSATGQPAEVLPGNTAAPLQSSSEQQASVQVSDLKGTGEILKDAKAAPVSISSAVESSLASDGVNKTKPESATENAQQQLFTRSDVRKVADVETERPVSGVSPRVVTEATNQFVSGVTPSDVDAAAKERGQAIPGSVASSDLFQKQSEKTGAQVTQIRQPVTAAIATAQQESGVQPQVQDSVRQQLKPDLAEMAGRLQSAAPESTTKAEPRQDSFLTGFADSLAAAKTIKQQSEPVMMSMPQGVKPGVPAFNQAVNERIMMLSTQNGRFAEIQLDPPELGSLQVKLQVKNDQVSVVFNTPHTSVREALEQGLPRLREMFEEQGLSLSDASVDDQGAEQQQDGESEADGYGGKLVSEGLSDAPASETVMQQESLNLVDYYA